MPETRPSTGVCRGGHCAPPAGRERLGASDCERIRDGLLAQPVNALTSLGFVVAGPVVAARGRAAPGAEVAVLAVSLTLTGAGSVAFHGPQPRGAKAMHDIPIAGLLVILAATPLVRRSRGRVAAPGWSRRRGLAAATLGAASAAAYVGGRTGSSLCDPDSRLQLHGAWHLLSAAAFVIAADILHRPIPGGAA